MNEEIKKMLEEVIAEEIDEVSSLKSGTDEKSKAVDDLAKLYKLHIESEKIKLEHTEKSQKQIADNRNEIENRSMEDDFRKKQLAEQRLDRYVKIGITGCELILPLIFYGVWMKRGFKFEENGTYTSGTFRTLWSHFRPAKK